MKKFFFLFSILIMTSCNQESIKSYTFYYWRTHLSLNKTEKAALQKATSPYIYTRFFDIEKINGKFQPIAVITKDSTFETDKEIIPVIFIKNDVFYGITMEEINFLAENISTLIKKKQANLKFIEAREIQIDCDWTAGTHKEYIAFLGKLKEFSGKTITLKIKYSDFSKQTRSKTMPYYISDKNLIFEIVKELLYQERLKDSVRLLGIALSNLNTEQKKTVVIQLQFDF